MSDTEYATVTVPAGQLITAHYAEATIGDGTHYRYRIQHTLMRQPIVSVVDRQSNRVVQPEITIEWQAVTITFAAVPANDQYRVALVA